MIWVHQARGRRGISTIHSTEYGRCGNQFYDGQSGRIRFQESAGTHWADRVITVSRALKQEVQWMYTVPDGKVSVVYNGVNARNYEGWINPGEVKRRYAIGDNGSNGFRGPPRAPKGSRSAHGSNPSDPEVSLACQVSFRGRRRIAKSTGDSDLNN